MVHIFSDWKCFWKIQFYYKVSDFFESSMPVNIKFTITFIFKSWLSKSDEYNLKTWTLKKTGFYEETKESSLLLSTPTCGRHTLFTYCSSLHIISPSTSNRNQLLHKMISTFPWVQESGAGCPGCWREEQWETWRRTLMARKFSPLSVARALAIMVFEQPGGPYRRTPLGGWTPIRVKDSGCFKGHSTACFNFSLIFSRPPISDQDTCKTEHFLNVSLLGQTEDLKKNQQKKCKRGSRTIYEWRRS